MTINKRKKFSRMRASHTHKWGSKKKHRGQGNRGGRGFAGTGKRADSFKPSVWNDVDFFGKHGFVKKGLVIKINPINISYLEENAEKLVIDKKIEKKGDIYSIDLSLLGYNKLLSEGQVHKKFNILCDYFSKKAEEKIKAAGGDISSRIAKKTEEKTAENSVEAPVKSAQANKTVSDTKQAKTIKEKKK